MAAYLAVPLKNTWDVDFTKPLRKFIQDTFTKASPDDYNPAIAELNKLRSNMISKWVDRHESALDVLFRYYDQMTAIETKLPITENQIRVDFKWQDAFDKESFWSGKRTLKISSGGYEKVCVLFNIGALQSQVAQANNHDSDEGLKSSAKLFQQAGGVFNHMKDCVMSMVQNDPTPDLHPDTLSALSALMVAQAQDCFFRKAVKDKMKPAIIAKVAHQCSDLYADALKLLQLQSIRELWPKDWIGFAAAKQCGMHSLAEFYQSELHHDAKEFGEQIARLKHAKELMTAAETRGGSAFCFKDEAGKINRSLAAVLKDNDFIYHAKVPDLKALPAIQKAVLAKPLPVPAHFSSDFTDLFAKIVPIAVHNAMVGFDNMKAEITTREVGRLRESTQTLNSILASLNLPAAIEDLGGDTVPASVLEKAAKVRELGGIERIGTLMKELPELLQRNKEILDEACNSLEEEEKSDKQLREQFKERWTRTSSDKLTGPLRAEADKYRTIISNAVQADAVVKQRYSQHAVNIELLSKSDAEISKSLPSGSPGAALKGSPVVTQLRQYMEEVETIKAERDVIENEIKDAKGDLSAGLKEQASKFMSALAQDGAISNEQLMTEEELDRIFSPLREQVNESLKRQEQLMGQIQVANDELCKVKSQNQSAASREQKLKDLAAAYDSFTELKGNLEEGTKFYNDLTQLLVKFQSKASDFCFARKTEKEELMKDLQQNIANQRTAPPPPPPTYQQPASQTGQTEESRGTPPARPPPPTRPPGSQPSQAAAAPAPAAPPAMPYAQTPYPVQPAAAPPAYPGMYGQPPMPQAYNPYPYGYPAQYPYPQQQYPGYPQQQYPGYPQQPGYPPQ